MPSQPANSQSPSGYKNLAGNRVKSKKDIAGKWAKKPIPEGEENTCCNQFKAVIHHVLPLLLLWILVVVFVTLWDLLWFPTLFLPLVFILIFWKRSRAKLVLLKWQLETFSWSFWLGSLAIFLMEIVLTFVLVFTTLLPHMNDIKDLWEQRPPDEFCQQGVTESSCSEKCAWIDDACKQQDAVEFVKANHKFFIGCVGIWIFGLLLSLLSAMIEEGWKYYFMRNACGKLPDAELLTKEFSSTIIMLSLMAGCGIGTGEAVQYGTIQDVEPLAALFTVLFRIVFRIPFHIITAYMTGCNLTRALILNRDYGEWGWFRCIRESFLFHTFYDAFTFFLLFALIVYKSSFFVVGCLIFLLNLFGVFLGLRARAELEEDMSEYDDTGRSKTIRPESIALDNQAGGDDKITIKNQGGRS